ncbi:hypothetical protein JI739_14905 [Ramlibacter sp. AW1]|uniref:Uncharacterized protein n=1 Tax=Ramlibacter aurantiacus TaxID=2801330 RepID=A0A936ZHQ0_9BURK|nr:hypothetical protein [Ramlibacter aurantiacus]MBL0421644.1 hypothetical protein [Ramlibacter aurantiacus]
MPNEKNSGDIHRPVVERDLPLQGGSEDGAQARGLEESREQGVRQAGIVKESEDAERLDKPVDKSADKSADKS